jgi:PHD/YefM family antitoxin component YafN of YafNO toxin-antitoxin module
MKFEKDRFLAGLRSIKPDLKLIEGVRKETFLAWLKTSGIPAEIAEPLADSIPTEYVIFRPCGYIYEDDAIIDSNEEYKRMMESGYLQVGHAPNGDQIVIDYRNGGRCGYISHDEFYESYEDEGLDVTATFIPLSESLGEMIDSLVNDPSFPIDSYEAFEKRDCQQDASSNR